MVYGGGDTKIVVFMKIFFPFDSGDVFIKLVRGVRLEFSDQKKDPVTCADKKVECQGIIESPFCLNA